MAGARIQGKEYPVMDILCDKFEFFIPRYQRPYAWQTEQAGTLLDDLVSALGDLDTKDDDIESYFLGSLVVVKEDIETKAEVVDGQQRLTTLTILLSVIRSLLVDPKQRGFLTPFIYREGNPIVGIEDHFHLTLREKDRQFFQDNIQKDIDLINLDKQNISDLSDSQKNIIINALLFRDKLKNYTQKQLFTISSYMLTQCYLIIVSTPNVDAAYRIFSVLNDRGLDLSFTDICKAEIIGKLGENQQEAYTRKWEDAEDQIGRESLKDVFAHIRTIFRKVKLTETILKEFRLHILPLYSSQDFIDTVLVPYVDAYDTIKTISYQSDRLAEEINRTLKWLDRIENSDWVPPAMFFYNKNKQDPEKLLKFLNDLERLAAYFTIHRANINVRLIRYAKVIDTIDHGMDLYDPASPLQLTDIERQETIDRLNGDIYNSGARLYILRRLDAALSENDITPDLPVITIEHVLPQNPKVGSQWYSWYPNFDEHKEIVHRLGNLVLLSKRKNSQANNYEFDTKKKSYFNSPLTPFALTTQIIRQETWKPEVLEETQLKHLQTLKKVWRL